MTPKFGEHWLMKCIVVFSFWGTSPPDPLTRGSAPGPRWGHSPQIPIIGSRYRARHSPPNAIKPNSAYANVEAYQTYANVSVWTTKDTRSSDDADNRRDAFSSQSRSTNMVPFWVHCDFSLSM